jgi:hypothetical protein
VNEVQEIEQIIEAANVAYREFVATGPDREVRDVVRNAVTFLRVDLTAAAEFAATMPNRRAA